MVLVRFILLSCCFALLSCGGAKKDGPPRSGKQLYDSFCVSCHGEDGTRGLSGAKDLSISALTKEEKIEMITNGKGGMAAYRALLSSQEIQNVADYIGELKK